MLCTRRLCHIIVFRVCLCQCLYNTLRIAYSMVLCMSLWIRIYGFRKWFDVRFIHAGETKNSDAAFFDKYNMWKRKTLIWNRMVKMMAQTNCLYVHVREEIKIARIRMCMKRKENFSFQQKGAKQSWCCSNSVNDRFRSFC